MGTRHAWLATGVAALLGGWLAPQYANKLWGTELSRFLQDCPVSAGVLPQCCWILLLPLGRRRGQLAPDTAESGSARCGQAARTGGALVALLACLVAVVHMAWYSSFSRTNVATNTLLWNTDTLTTPLAALIIARERPTSGAVIGGVIGLVGAGVAAGASAAGDTLLGCGLVSSASFGFAINTVLVEKVRDPSKLSVIRLLGLEGCWALAALGLAMLGSWALRPEALAGWLSALPPAAWLAFLGSCSICLNVGWLWCAEIAGSFWTAMVACAAIPITVVLDALLLGTQPTPVMLLGSLLVVVGFTIASWPTPRAAADADSEVAVGDCASGPCCRRWEGWSQARAAPLLPAPPLSPGSASTAATGAGLEEGVGSDDADSCSCSEVKTPPSEEAEHPAEEEEQLAEEALDAV